MIETLSLMDSLRVLGIHHLTGEILWDDTYKNLVTDQGDLYCAQKLAAGVGSTAVGNPAFINGMKLGTGGGSTAKTGGALTTYYPTGNAPLDAGWPKLVNLGPTNGVQVEYQTTYVAGTVLSAAISEAALVTDAGANLTSAASQTIARSLIGPYDLSSGVATLVLVWHKLQKGA